MAGGFDFTPALIGCFLMGLIGGISGLYFFMWLWHFISNHLHWS